MNGTVSELETNPSIVNDNPYSEGWLIEVGLTNSKELDSLLDLEEYERFVEEQK